MVSDKTEAAIKAFIKNSDSAEQRMIVKRVLSDLLSNNSSAVRLWKGIADEQQARADKLEAKMQAPKSYRRAASLAVALCLALASPAYAEPVQIGEAINVTVSVTVVSMCQINEHKGILDAQCDGQAMEPVSDEIVCDDKGECTRVIMY